MTVDRIDRDETAFGVLRDYQQGGRLLLTRDDLGLSLEAFTLVFTDEGKHELAAWQTAFQETFASLEVVLEKHRKDGVWDKPSHRQQYGEILRECLSALTERLEDLAEREA